MFGAQWVSLILVENRSVYMCRTGQRQRSQLIYEFSQNCETQNKNRLNNR